MANPEQGEVELVVAGVSYALRLTTWASCELEAKTGQAWHWHIQKWLDTGHSTPLVWVFWAALQSRHGEQFRTLQEVADLLDAVDDVDALKRIVLQFAALNHGVRENLARMGLLPLAPEKKAIAPADPAAPDGSGSIPKLARSA